MRPWMRHTCHSGDGRLTCRLSHGLSWGGEEPDQQVPLRSHSFAGEAAGLADPSLDPPPEAVPDPCAVVDNSRPPPLRLYCDVSRDGWGGGREFYRLFL